MKSIKNLNKGQEGIDFLNKLVKTYNRRDCNDNSNKTPVQLINEFLDYSNGLIDLSGNKQ